MVMRTLRLGQYPARAFANRTKAKRFANKMKRMGKPAGITSKGGIHLVVIKDKRYFRRR